HGFEIDEVIERTGHVQDRFAGADPGGFGVVQLNVELDVARRGGRFEKLDREARCADDRAAHEHRIAGLAVAEPTNDLLGLQEIAVSPRGPVTHWNMLSSRSKRS